MSLKIIHHREKKITDNKNTLESNIKNSLTKMLVFCENIIDVLDVFFKKKNELIKNNYFDEKNTNHDNEMLGDINLFHFISGKKMSPIEAILKITSIMQKINILANNFGISLFEDCDKDEEILTDEDIDVLVQMVKDFGEKQIREDAKEYREKKIQKNINENLEKNDFIDVYNVYHNDNEAN